MAVAESQIPPLYRALDPDDIPEFHAARLLLLIHICGTGSRARRIDGRTKLVKLDFFLRYPRFLERAEQVLFGEGRPHTDFDPGSEEIEAPMIRYRYGPWDPRYRTYLAFLESRGLVRKVGATLEGVSLTADGSRVAAKLRDQPEYRPIVERASAMVGNMAEWTGSEIKDFIYAIFDREVGQLTMREEIAP
jgi:hypothetical protein